MTRNVSMALFPIVIVALVTEASVEIHNINTALQRRHPAGATRLYERTIRLSVTIEVQAHESRWRRKGRIHYGASRLMGTAVSAWNKVKRGSVGAREREPADEGLIVNGLSLKHRASEVEISVRWS